MLEYDYFTKAKLDEYEKKISELENSHSFLSTK